MRRMLVGMSQEKLGEALGLTFQQVQKYEKGTNRISASRLQQISEALNIPLSFLFKGAPVSDGAVNGGFAEGAEDGLRQRFRDDGGRFEPQPRFCPHRRSEGAKKIVDLVTALSEGVEQVMTRPRSFVLPNEFWRTLDETNAIPLNKLDLERAASAARCRFLATLLLGESRIDVWC